MKFISETSIAFHDLLNQMLLRPIIKMNASTKPIQPSRWGAFTLVELLVVLAVVAILAALVIPASLRVMASARTSGCMSDLRQVHAAMMAYAVDNDGRLPRPYAATGPGEGFSWERALARPSDGGVYLSPESIHPGGNRRGNIRRLLFNREVAYMGGDPRRQNPNFVQSNYQMNHEFNLSFGKRHGGSLNDSPHTMFQMGSFEWPSKTMLLMSAWAPGYRIPFNRSERGDLDSFRGPAFIHNGDKAIVLYAAGNIGLLTREQVPTDTSTREWREFWLPTLIGSEWE